MYISGLARVKRIKEDKKIIKGVFEFISEHTGTVEKIGFLCSSKNLDLLEKAYDDNELLELSGTLFKEDAVFYIKISNIKMAKTKYNLFNNAEESII